eukprot:scaffold2030_cov388-Prasinococcus_capsulatus_cf.AAC.3
MASERFKGSKSDSGFSVRMDDTGKAEQQGQSCSEIRCACATSSVWYLQCDRPDYVCIARPTVATAPAPVGDVATVIDGKAIAAKVREEIAEEVKAMKETKGFAPGLAVVLVGERKDSQTYVRSKKKACEEAGIVSYGADLPADATQEEVLQVVRTFNEDPNVHGILVRGTSVLHGEDIDRGYVSSRFLARSALRKMSTAFIP